MAVVQRNSEITRLYDRVMARENMLLHAPDGMGKTHLIDDLFQKLEGRRICFYISVKGLVGNRQLVQALAGRIRKTASQYPNVDYQLRRFFEDNPLPQSDELKAIHPWLENLLVALQSISQDFLFAIDDIDQWEGKDEVNVLLHHFFGSRNSNILLTARHTNPDLDLVTPIELPPLTASNFNEAHESPALDELIEYSRGNTGFVLELLGSGNLEDLNMNKATFRVLSHAHPFFYAFRHRFTDLQWRLLRAIANEEKVLQPHAFEFLMNYRLGAASSIERALKNLSDSKMIHRTAEGWQVENVIFHRWLQWLYAH